MARRKKRPLPLPPQQCPLCQHALPGWLRATKCKICEKTFLSSSTHAVYCGWDCRSVGQKEYHKQHYRDAKARLRGKAVTDKLAELERSER
jgi:hypothetical protein